MPKPHKIKLTIPNPCSENWDKMTLTDKGKFCKRCCNIITDFSVFTDKELVDYLSNIKGKVCGRFENTQLNRVIAIHEPANTPIFRKVLFGTALAAGVVVTAKSQSNSISNTTSGTTISATSKNSNSSITAKQTQADSTNILKGIVKDKKTGQPIPNAEMLMQYDSIHTALIYSDSNGNFSVPVPDAYMNKKITLETLVYGYIQRNITIGVKKFNKQYILRLQKSKEDTSKVVGYLMM